MTPTPEYEFAPDETPTMPGAPFSPRHEPARRIAYAFVGVFVGLCTTFPNGLVSANLATLPGSIDAYLADASWLPAVYVAMNASANLTLVKARAQFGIPAVILTLLALYVVADILQLLWPHPRVDPGSRR